MSILFEPKRTSQVFGISNTVLPDSYVDRGALDFTLAKLLARPTHIALRGESKCGKSWLRQKVVPGAIVVQCRIDRGVHDLYVDALSQLGVQLILENKESGKITGRVEAQGGFGSGLIAKALGFEAKVTAGATGESGDETKLAPVGHDVSDLRFVADLLKASNRRLVVEDFHYLSGAERTKFAFDMKALWDYGLFIMIVGVWSQSNMLISLNPDLSSRIEEVSIQWSADDLTRVLKKGGDVLNIEFAEPVVKRLVDDCYWNVGILQALTLKTLDAVGLETKCKVNTVVDDLDAFTTAALQHAEQLNPRYQQFAKRVAGGIRKRKDATGIYAHAMAVILATPDELALRGIPLDLIFNDAHAREPRIQKGNLRTVLERFEELQVDEEGRGLVLSYNEAVSEVTIVDRQLLLYRKYCTVRWPWEDLIAEAKAAEEGNGAPL